MKQEEFLGHTNFNGHTTSMRELQKVQQDFWTAVFVAIINQGSGAAYATTGADNALAVFNTRFVPIELKPDDLRC